MKKTVKIDKEVEKVIDEVEKIYSTKESHDSYATKIH